MTIPDNVDDAFALAYLATGVADWTSATDANSTPPPHGCVKRTSISAPIGQTPLNYPSYWLCGYVKMKDGEGVEDKVYDYVNAFLDPSSTEPLLGDGFGHANQSGMPVFSEEELVVAGLGEIDVPLLAQLPMSNELRTKHSEAFEKIKAGF